MGLVSTREKRKGGRRTCDRNVHGDKRGDGVGSSYDTVFGPSACGASEMMGEKANSNLEGSPPGRALYICLHYCTTEATSHYVDMASV